MTRALILLIPILALTGALSCRSHPTGSDRDTSRTVQDNSIASTNRPFRPGELKDRNCINLNTAGVETLMTLPGIGQGFADKIIEYRSRYGPFQRPQDIIIINGFGERRYHRIEPYVCAY
jgi:competence protein ComEA